MVETNNPFIKLMVIGLINGRVKEMLCKEALTDIDVKLLKGLFLRKTT
jgi:hypothetical protein